MPRKRKQKRVSMISKYENRISQKRKPAKNNYDHSYASTELSTLEKTCESLITSTCTSEEEHDVMIIDAHEEHHKTSRSVEERDDEDVVFMDTSEATITIPEISEEVEISTSFTPYEQLRDQLHSAIESPYYMNQSALDINICENYATNNPAIKLSIVIRQDFTAELFVHRQLLPRNHELWTGLPNVFNTVSNVNLLLKRLKCFAVCMGNPDEKFQELTPIGSGLSSKASHEIIAYREGDFGATNGLVSYNSTIRSVQCCLLVIGKRCRHCATYRRTLWSRCHRLEQRDDNHTMIGPGIKHSNFRKEDFIKKIRAQKQQIKGLQYEINKMKRQFQHDVVSKGVLLDKNISEEIQDTMKSCEDEMRKAFPDVNCVQRLFWDEQMKSNRVKSSNGMKWHPMIIRWCLYLRQKSSAAYDALRESGFINLPSSRTLYDYTHFSNVLGFEEHSIKQLCDLVTNGGMIDDENPWKSNVGLLFDEIRVKSDLVYDKYTGELIGYVNLDSVGNEMLKLERGSRNDSQEEVATCLLVLMLRGVCTDLMFPLAAFATTSVTADFLYPIIWKAISIIEVRVGMKVLFCTCDGASANRRFIKLHSKGGEDVVYYADNPFDINRKVYFISDVPHLLKTTRNCFSNSFSHKNTRKLWKNGKDISWMQIVSLFEDHCEGQLYSPCPKLKRSHIDLTAFSCMKVNLAVQVLSSTIANALEFFYDARCTETVKFIRHMNKFFDCLNVRNVLEGRNKRNPDLDAFTRTDDPRLQWLQEDFLDFFIEWESSVVNRVGTFSKSQQNSMMLSKQTVEGLKITVHSIVSCVKSVLNDGAKFVLTHRFNQDPLEQLFGHLRQKGGANSNPTVAEANRSLQKMRNVRQLALPVRNGNVSRGHHAQRVTVDNTPIARRQYRI